MRRRAEEEDVALLRRLAAHKQQADAAAAAEAERAAAEARARADAEAAAAAAAAAAAEKARLSEGFKAEGNALFKSGAFHDAARAYSQAIDVDGDNAVLHSNRSGACAQHGQSGRLGGV